MCGRLLTSTSPAASAARHSSRPISTRRASCARRPWSLCRRTSRPRSRRSSVRARTPFDRRSPVLPYTQPGGSNTMTGAHARLVFAGMLVAAGLGLWSSARVAAQTKSWVVQRTADGHPDFQGVWANNTVTPLQRPTQWEGKTRLTDAEIKDLQTFAAQITENDGDAQFGDGFITAVLNKLAKPNSYDPGTGNYNQFWVVERDWHDRRT